MTTELATKLFHAGFRMFVAEKNCRSKVLVGGIYMRPPTLEELIEACGESFGSLYAGGSFGWVADKSIHELEQEGSTPSEAVANLWLALNTCLPSCNPADIISTTINGEPAERCFNCGEASLI